MAVKRLFVEKKQGLFDTKAKSLKKELVENLHLKKLDDLRLFRRYDIEDIAEDDFNHVLPSVFYEPPVDNIYFEELPHIENAHIFTIVSLDGQFDMTADSASQCISLITQKESPLIKSGEVIALIGNLTSKEIEKVKNYTINKVEKREDTNKKPSTLKMNLKEVKDVEILTGFNTWSEARLHIFKDDLNLAMNFNDLVFCQKYFRKIDRDPTITEIKVIDTYWSDHCRHTTFTTHIDDVKIDLGKYNELFLKSYNRYLEVKKLLSMDKKPITLMDIATIAMKKLRKTGYLNDLDVSEEINACSINIKVDVEGEEEDYLLMFKNETHNHPTEIEPFGGAATCIGGAIRDPLSGRAYVYQGMRITGSGDIREKVEDTLKGKLPQQTISKGATAGYSSYGNQIGLATGFVREIYHPGYKAKHMEIGAVVAAVPKENVKREIPKKGDIILLVGGDTGRDGIGGATGSSKDHNLSSLDNCGAEVQKGNAPTERKLQRLFRNPKVSKMIKRCNDFGAGGVSVAIGELTDSLIINLDAVPKKYEGLDGTEIAISESQERMAVVIDKNNEERFIAFTKEENLKATKVAQITDDNHLVMMWQGKKIVDIDRDFLKTNGETQHIKATISMPEANSYFAKLKENIKSTNAVDLWFQNLKDLNICSQKGMVEHFDSTIGTSTVLMPYGGKKQMTPINAMVAKIPVLNKDTNTATAMSYGFNPHLSSWSPFHGSVYAILDSVAKLISCGCKIDNIRLTLQEYFKKLGTDPKNWGQPLASLLGAFYIEEELSIPAIGGKDSMSGSFMDLSVPPTLVSFAITTVDSEKVISPEFKDINHKVVYIPLHQDEYHMPNTTEFINNAHFIHSLINKEKVYAAQTVELGGIAVAIAKMCFGNNLGFVFKDSVEKEYLFMPYYGGIILEVKDDVLEEVLEYGGIYLGTTQKEYKIIHKEYEIDLNTLEKEYKKPLSKLYPEFVEHENIKGNIKLYHGKNNHRPQEKYLKPTVFMPIFPGTNCEYDTEKAFHLAGANVETFVVKNLTPKDIEESAQNMAKKIRDSQIIMLPGGFSGGDEPDGSGKFIAAMFRNPYITEEVRALLQKRDGLILGICNGFQALIKLGLLPYGDILSLKENSPTLTYNTIGRHISKLQKTMVVSNLSPWLTYAPLGEIYDIPISHGEGRFYATNEDVELLQKNGQIATQYVDEWGNIATTGKTNPNGSMYAIEGITSLDGRIFGKMGHSERIGKNLYKNVLGKQDQQIFKAGVDYFK